MDQRVVDTPEHASGSLILRGRGKHTNVDILLSPSCDYLNRRYLKVALRTRSEVEVRVVASTLRSEFMSVKWDELLEAFEWVSAGGTIDTRAWVCRTSGKVFLWDSDTGGPLAGEDFDEDEFNEEEEDKLPEDAESFGETGDDAPGNLPAEILDEDKYLPVPDKRELDLGSRLPFAFTRQFLPGDYEGVRRIFSKRGAYSRFKDLLADRKALDQWYQFEQKATEEALRDWCIDNALEIEEPEPKRP
jgi:hypothetical protein